MSKLTNNSLSISFSSSIVAGEGKPWVRLEQLNLASATASIGETADLVNKIYQIDPCNKASKPKNSSFIPIDKFKSVVKNSFDMNLCDISPDGSAYITVRVIISDPTIPYVLHFIGNGVITSTKIIEEVRKVLISVKESKTYKLLYPVTGYSSFSWGGTVWNSFGSVGLPPITLTNNILYFPEKITGIISAEFQTKYFLIAIKLPPSNADKLLCFYSDEVAALTLTRPVSQGTLSDWQKYCNPQDKWVFPIPDITCYEDVELSWRCECDTNQESGRSVTTKRAVPCPNGYAQWGMTPGGDYKIGDKYEIAGYEHCPDLTTNYGAVDLSDPDYYAQICCHAPTNITLPKCSTVTSKNSGGAGIENGEDFYRKIYGPNTKFVPVSPSDGDCGVTETTQLVIQQNCCDGVVPIYWDYDNSAEVIADNSKALVVVTGGQAPYTWKIRGSGFWGNAAHTWRDVETDVPYLWIYTADACGHCDIYVTDGCSKTSGLVKSTVGQWTGDCIANYWSNISLDVYIQYVYSIYSNIIISPVVYKCGICIGGTYTVSDGWYTTIDVGTGNPFIFDHTPAGSMVWVNTDWAVWDDNYSGVADPDCTLDGFSYYPTLYSDWMAATSGMAGRGVPPNLWPADYAPNGPSDIVDMLCYDDPNAIPCQWVC